MKILFVSLNLKDIFMRLNESFNNKQTYKGFEYSVKFPRRLGCAEMSGFDFGNGFSLIIIHGDVFRLLSFGFQEKNMNVLRCFFMSNGYMVHSISSSFRYSLTTHTSSIVARRDNQFTQEIIFPAQKSLEILILQIDTQKYIRNIDPEFLNIPSDLANIYINRMTKEYFLYQNFYSFSVSETLTELKNIPTEGLVKRFYVESKALELLWIQTKHYKDEQLYGFDKNIIKAADLKIIREAKNYIDENLGENITLTKLARIVGTNETKLQNGLKKLFGKTFGEILRNERLIRAKSLLEDGELNIKEISYNVGYTSCSIFSKRFKEKYGSLPSDYLKGN